MKEKKLHQVENFKLEEFHYGIIQMFFSPRFDGIQWIDFETKQVTWHNETRKQNKKQPNNQRNLNIKRRGQTKKYPNKKCSYSSFTIKSRRWLKRNVDVLLEWNGFYADFCCCCSFPFSLLTCFFKFVRGTNQHKITQRANFKKKKKLTIHIILIVKITLIYGLKSTGTL